MSADVLVTGIGIVSPAGIGCEATWSALAAGGRAVWYLDDVCLNGHGPVCGARVPISRTAGGGHDVSRTCQLAVMAADEALRSAGFSPGEADGSLSAMAVSIGTSKPVLDASSLSDLAGSSLFGLLPDAPARLVAARFGLGGPVHASVSACATGTHAIIRGAQMIRQGDAHLVLAGSADSSLDPLWLAAYQQMGVLAPPHPELGPAWACRPFDHTRHGFVIGEGAAMVVLESPESARSRGRRGLGRILGWAAGSDPAGLTALSNGQSPESPLGDIVRLALTDAACKPAQLQAIYAHGTATAANDPTETRAFRQALGTAVRGIPITSLKGAIGHLMGAAGAIEAALAILSCAKAHCLGINTLLEPDPSMEDLDLCRETRPIGHGPILKTSLGFGGHLAALILGPA